MQVNLNRWWVYLQERFPVIKNGLLIAVFSSSAVSYSFLLRGGVSIPCTTSLIVAFVCIFIFFLQLRIIDEFKDFADDSLYRAYRPIPRGLISLNELGWVGMVSAIIQLGLSLYLTPALALILGAVWFYLALMSQEFFVSQWLKSHPLIYMLSHMVIVPLINLYGTACDWLVVNATIPSNSLWFLLTSFFNGMVIEIGRKIRVPDDEEFGVETYSKLWGYEKASGVWLLVLGLTAACACEAAIQIKFATPIICLLTTLFIFALLTVRYLLDKPITERANLIEKMSGLWALFVYFGLGVAPHLPQVIIFLFSHF